MTSVHEEEVVSDLLNIKSKLEDSLNELQDEKENLKKKILTLKEQKEILRKEKNEELQKLFNLKLDLADVEKQVQDNHDHVLKMGQTIDDIGKNIHSLMQLEDFKEKTMKLQSSYESAIGFYSEESLQMELLKRTANVREQRVAYTKAESDYNDMIRRIEEEKREKERIRLAQLERERQEEEYRKQQESERAQAEQAKSREEFLRSRSDVAMEVVQQPFLGKIQSPVSSFKLNSNTGPGDDCPASDSESSNVNVSKTKSSFFNDSLSQLFKW